MCTVLQQHLNKLANGYHLGTETYEAPRGRSITPGISTYSHQRVTSPFSATPTPVYSYLQDSLTLKRPVDVYDKTKKVVDPVKLPHFHIPVNPDGSRIPSRSRSSYMQQLYGRRSRSLSRTGMRKLVDELQASAPRPRSPHMNNEEAISLSHYPDGRKPDENIDKKAPIERDDFPAPPFVYHSSQRRRHWSEPERNGHHDSESEGVRTPFEESSDDEKEFVDEKLDKSEAELKKISSGMGKIFLTEIAIEKEKRKMSQKRFLDPRSAARTPSANREPPYRLRYDSPYNASPSRIADHGHPWDDDILDGTISRRSYTPYLQVTPGTTLGRVVSPVQPVKPGYTLAPKSYTLPSRYSPYYVDKAYSTDYGSKSDISDGDIQYKHGGTGVITATLTSTPNTMGRSHSAGENGHDVSGVQLHDVTVVLPQANNVYPIHLLQTTNYRLPGDVDSNNLERHLTDTDFEVVFRMTRDDFYQIPYWKRCEIKKRHLLF